MPEPFSEQERLSSTCARELWSFKKTLKFHHSSNLWHILNSRGTFLNQLQHNLHNFWVRRLTETSSPAFNIPSLAHPFAPRMQNYFWYLFWGNGLAIPISMLAFCENINCPSENLEMSIICLPFSRGFESHWFNWARTNYFLSKWFITYPANKLKFM